MSQGTFNKTPKRESERLDFLQSLCVLDTDFEEEFNDFVYIAQSISKVPIALVSLIDETRQWFKAKVGLEVRETPRNISFCTHVVYHGKELYVSDAKSDSFFKDNPLVKDGVVGFYAGFPIKTKSELTLGSLCVIDSVANSLSERQKADLRRLSHLLADQIELRYLKTKQDDIKANALNRLREVEQSIKLNQSIADVTSSDFLKKLSKSLESIRLDIEAFFEKFITREHLEDFFLVNVCEVIVEEFRFLYESKGSGLNYITPKESKKIRADKKFVSELIRKVLAVLNNRNSYTSFLIELIDDKVVVTLDIESNEGAYKASTQQENKEFSLPDQDKRLLKDFFKSVHFDITFEEHCITMRFGRE